MPTKIGHELELPVKAVAPYPTGVEYRDRIELTDGVMKWCVSRTAWEQEMEFRSKPKRPPMPPRKPIVFQPRQLPLEGLAQ